MGGKSVKLPFEKQLSIPRAALRHRSESVQSAGLSTVPPPADLSSGNCISPYLRAWCADCMARIRKASNLLVAEVRLRRYQRLLVGSRKRVKKLWSDAAESRSVFGQNVAGGTAHIVVRQSISTGLESWWQSDSFSSAVVHGAEGMGKTCAAVQWAQSPYCPFRLRTQGPYQAATGA